MSASLPRLALVTANGQSLADRQRALSAALAVVAAGEALVLLRDKTRTTQELTLHARALVSVCAARSAPLFVDLCPTPAGAHRHVTDRADAEAVIAAHRAGAAEVMVSVSTHAPERAAWATTIADVVYLGPIWPTTDKPVGLGCAAIEAAVAAAPGPGRIFAIGGIDRPERVSRALAAGAHGVAGIRAFAAETLESLATAAKGPTTRLP